MKRFPNTLCALELQTQISDLVERYVFMENCVVVGRGLQYGNAYELALKLMETCYVVAERFRPQTFCTGRSRSSNAIFRFSYLRRRA
jgi:glucosamine--fructose-6-phosphate aminotransferase (isomerizing)